MLGRKGVASRERPAGGRRNADDLGIIRGRRCAMGGPGSGAHYYHWWRPAKKTTVEECESLDACRWTREGILRAGVHLMGSWRWVYHGGRENSIGYEANTLDPALPVVRLFYSFTRAQTGE